MSDQNEQSLALREDAVEEVPEAGISVVDDEISNAQIKASERQIDLHWRPDRAKVRTMRLFLKAYEKHGTIKEACSAAGISPRQLVTMRTQYAWFDRRVEECFNTNISMVEDTAFEMATDGQSQVMTRWYLERAKPEKWGKSQDKGNGPPLTIHIEQTVYDAI